MSASRDDWLTTRISLLERLRDADDGPSWEEFCDTYGRVVHAVAVKSGLSAVEVEEVVQETLIAVARQIGDFHYDSAKGAFKSWLLTIARRRIVDQFRKRGRERRFEPPPADDSSQTAFLHRLPDDNAVDLDALFEQEWRQGLYEAALERVRRTSAPREVQIFDLYVTREWPVEKVAETLKATPNQIYVAKHRVGEAIAAEVARLAGGEVA